MGKRNAETPQGIPPHMLELFDEHERTDDPLKRAKLIEKMKALATASRPQRSPYGSAFV